MTDREYLRSLGFSVGERGRFSKDMLDALAARSASDKHEFINDAYEQVGLPTPAVPVRAAQELYGYTKEGTRVGFVMCFSCADHMMWCECPDGIMAPKIVAVVKTKDPLVRLHPSHV